MDKFWLHHFFTHANSIRDTQAFRHPRSESKIQLYKLATWIKQAIKLLNYGWIFPKQFPKLNFFFKSMFQLKKKFANLLTRQSFISSSILLIPNKTLPTTKLCFSCSFQNWIWPLMRTAQHVKDIMPETTNSGHLSVNFYHDKFSTLDMHHICTNTSSWCAMGGTSRLGPRGFEALLQNRIFITTLVENTSRDIQKWALLNKSQFKR